MPPATIPVLDRAAEPFSDDEVKAIMEVAAQATSSEAFEVVAVAGRPIAQPEAVDRELQNLGVKKPGETIFDFRPGPSSEMRFDATMTGVPDDMIDVLLYNRQGYPVKMKKSMARVRIGKRSSEDGQPVFFLRPPVQAPVATLGCMYPGCRKQFYTEAAQRTHYENRHTTAARQNQQNEERAERRRLIALQERQIDQGAATAAALQLLVERLARGESVDAAEARVALESVPNGDAFDSMTRDDLKKYCDDNGIRYPAQWQQLSKDHWRAIARGDDVIAADGVSAAVRGVR